MPRAKGGPYQRRHHKEVRSLTKGQWGSRHRLWKRAHEALIHSWSYAYAHRRERKGDMRRLWIARINAAARLNDIPYGRLIHGLKQASVELDRKALADLAIRDPGAFAQIAQRAKEGLGGTP